MGPEPTTTTVSPSCTSAISCALIAHANGSATDASAKPTPSGMRLSPSTASTVGGTIMNGANPPS